MTTKFLVPSYTTNSSSQLRTKRICFSYSIINIDKKLECLSRCKWLKGKKSIKLLKIINNCHQKYFSIWQSHLATLILKIKIFIVPKKKY